MAIFSLKSKEVLSNLTAPANVDLGAMIPIATQTVGAGGSSTVTFSSIPQNYEHLELRIFCADSSTADLLIRFNGDSTVGNYRYHNLYGDGSSAAVYDYGAAAEVRLAFPFQGTNSSTSFMGGIFSILDYTNTNKYKTTRTLMGLDRNGSGQVSLQSGLWMNTSAINSILITVTLGTFSQYSHFALYGIKRAGA